MNQNSKSSCKNDTCQNKIIFNGQKSYLKNRLVIQHEAVIMKK
jgi:hypothetical protein